MTLRIINSGFIVISIFFLAIILTACRSAVKIGAQTWTAKNLSVSTFRNGAAIPHAKTDVEWIKAAEAKKPAWCYYNNDAAKGKKYGKLYNWYAVHDSRGLAPHGWHVPDIQEWTALANCLGGVDVAGGKLKATTSWNSPNLGATDSCGFTGLPAGLRDYDGTFNGIGSSCCWWTISVCDTARAWDWLLLYSGGIMHSTMDAKALGLSVRCIKNK